MHLLSSRITVLAQQNITDGDEQIYG